MLIVVVVGWHWTKRCNVHMSYTCGAIYLVRLHNALAFVFSERGFKASCPSDTIFPMGFEGYLKFRGLMLGRILGCFGSLSKLIGSASSAQGACGSLPGCLPGCFWTLLDASWAFLGWLLAVLCTNLRRPQASWRTSRRKFHAKNGGKLE